jgi:hypothetical protein
VIPDVATRPPVLYFKTNGARHLADLLPRAKVVSDCRMTSGAASMTVDDFCTMIVCQLTPASCTLACFESFLGQNGICITQNQMKAMRPDICGDLKDNDRCVYTQHYSEVGHAFGFTCSEITGPDVPFPCYPTSAILMGTDVLYGTPHSLLWTYMNKSNGVGFAIDPAANHYLRFHLSKLNEYKLWHLRIAASQQAGCDDTD